MKNPEGAEAVFLELSDFPNLLPSVSTTFEASQSSQSSHCSTRSDLELEIPVGDSVRKRKAFEDLGPRAKKLRTDDLSALNECASDCDISLSGLAAYLGYRASYVHDRELSSALNDLFCGKSLRNTVDPTLVLYLKERCQIGRSVYTDVCLLLKDQVCLPPYDKLHSLVSDIRPSIVDWEFGVRANLRECVTSTLERILHNHKNSIPDFEQRLVAKCFMGVDGSGGHSVYNSPSSLASGVDTTHMMVAGFTVPSITVDDPGSTEVYHDNNCSSAFSERPLLIIPGAESRDRMKLIMALFDREIDDLTVTPLRLQVSEGVFIECMVQAEISQLDGKAIKTSTGLTGAYCTCCTVTEKEAKSVERINQGFTIDRNINELNESYLVLKENSEEDVPVPTRRGDESVRKGLNQRPLTSRYTDGQKDKLKEAKLRFREAARTGPLHMKLDVPDSSGHGGTSDTAEMARAFFTQNNREHFLGLVAGTVAEREGLRKLHENVSIILRVFVSKNHEVDIQGYERLCLKTYGLIPEVFPWASIPHSIHRVLAHSAERMQANECCGLGMLSEEGLESLHKYVRRFRDILARKTSLRANLSDVFTHLWVRSDPVVRAHQRTVSCSHCFREGHSIRSCPQRISSCDNSDDAKVASFFV